MIARSLIVDVPADQRSMAAAWGAKTTIVDLTADGAVKCRFTGTVRGMSRKRTLIRQHPSTTMTSPSARVAELAE